MQLGWIPKLDWFFPCILITWGTSNLYTFYKNKRSS